jgi:uncharacterized protein (DUF169 family)
MGFEPIESAQQSCSIASAFMGISDYKVQMSKRTLTDLYYRNDTWIYAIEACTLYNQLMPEFVWKSLLFLGGSKL